MSEFDPESFDPNAFDPANLDLSDFERATALVDMTPGRMLRVLREMAELTQAQLAERAGMQQSVISALESGRDNIGIERAKTLARALQVHPAVIAFPTGSRTKGRRLDGRASSLER